MDYCKTKHIPEASTVSGKKSNTCRRLFRSKVRNLLGSRYMALPCCLFGLLNVSIDATAAGDLDYNNGLRFQEGRGVVKDLASAANYFRLAASKGHVLAQYNYGQCLSQGCGIAQNLEQAAEYFKRAADNGYVLAQNEYGLILATGRGVPVNFDGAAKYFKLGADQGYAEARYNYGICLENGYGIAQNPVEAARCYK
ncbi:MAG: sel1 repeat family protein, partial [Holosporales bacterium]|nr:sel1 repeat family protein [Holosporales bacterium]